MATSGIQPPAFTYSEGQMKSLLRAISADRFSSYLAAEKGDTRSAIRNYELNTALSEALYGVLQGFEVLLRNSIHDTMRGAFGRDNWYRHVGLAERELESVEKAERKIHDKGKTVTPSRTVAELTLGFWTALVGRPYTDSLWVPHLRRAFPTKNLARKVVHARLDSIRTLRNQIAHHECIIFRKIEEDYSDILEASTWICADTALWIRHATRFEGAYRFFLKKDLVIRPPQ